MHELPIARQLHNRVKGGSGFEETQEYTDQVQCHEATHQLVHFYTWDITRKITGKTPKWLDALTRPLWSTEGFAEFFSSHKVEGGKYSWMVPLENRMEQLWIFDESRGAYSDDIGTVLAEVEGPAPSYTFTGDELYVRARITSSQPHPNPSEPNDTTMAWTQPAVVASAGSAQAD